MSHLYKNNWFALSLLISGAIVAIISVVGFTFNPNLFSSFSLPVLFLIFAIASYMIYNILKIAKELDKVRD